MPESVKAAATKAVSVAGNAVSSKKAENTTAQEQDGSKAMQDETGKNVAQPNKNADGAAPEKRAEKITLPRAFKEVEWDMNRAEITQLYPIARKRNDNGERVLTHYRNAAQTYSVRFRFQENTLVEVETRITAAEGEKVEELYETLKNHYNSRYGHFAESKTRWSDGTTTARIFSMGDRVYMRFERRPEATSEQMGRKAAASR
jgi:hypothetical protein